MHRLIKRHILHVPAAATQPGKKGKRKKLDLMCCGPSIATPSSVSTKHSSEPGSYKKQRRWGSGGTRSSFGKWTPAHHGKRDPAKPDRNAKHSRHTALLQNCPKLTPNYFFLSRSFFPALIYSFTQKRAALLTQHKKIPAIFTHASHASTCTTCQAHFPANWINTSPLFPH